MFQFVIKQNTTFDRKTYQLGWPTCTFLELLVHHRAVNVHSNFTVYDVHNVHSSLFKNVHFNSTSRYRKLIMYRVLLSIATSKYKTMRLYLAGGVVFCADIISFCKDCNLIEIKINIKFSTSKPYIRSFLIVN